MQQSSSWICTATSSVLYWGIQEIMKAKHPARLFIPQKCIPVVLTLQLEGFQLWIWANVRRSVRDQYHEHSKHGCVYIVVISEVEWGGQLQLRVSGRQVHQIKISDNNIQDMHFPSERPWRRIEMPLALHRDSRASTEAATAGARARPCQYKKWKAPEARAYS